MHFHSLCSLSIDKKRANQNERVTKYKQYIYIYRAHKFLMEIISSFTARYTLYRTWQVFFSCFNLLFFVSIFFSPLFVRFVWFFSSSFFFWVVVAFFRNFEAWRECANARYQLHCGESIRSVVFNHGTQITFRPFGCCCFFPHVFVRLYSRSTENTHSNGFEFHRVGHSFRFPFSFIRRPKPNANKRLIHQTQKKLTLYTIK